MAKGDTDIKGGLRVFDPADYLKTGEAVGTFIDDAFKTDDAAHIAHRIGIATRAKGISKIAEDAGLSPEQLKQSFSHHGNPTLAMTLSAMKAMGLKLVCEPRLSFWWTGPSA
ncbi:probable addiction module antidote protein [Cohaesibacter marisflavi]|uniref:Probable addiction module antidote protein n=1 Tax=Cohaesibacter marisflavi TaxID=655353 RepID=A0A1I5MF78_9HYPH|nr:addiction module antidote protein [Cohaesibacter marisflavi]SFP08235.1 probable addiction module antidote protein [Cohaesibacter marisflavi]